MYAGCSAIIYFNHTTTAYVILKMTLRIFMEHIPEKFVCIIKKDSNKNLVREEKRKYDMSDSPELNNSSDQQDTKQQHIPGWMTTPLSKQGWPAWAVYLMAAVGFIYILNPTFGILEFIPDNFPIIGNIDEGLAALLVWAGLVELFEGRKDN